MILLFSGTGNSLHVAKILSECLGDRVIKLPGKGDLIPNRSERIIWVFPVYSWGVPPVVLKWISGIQIENADKVPHHLVVTCGDDIGLADRMWRKAIESRGWTTAGVYSVQMPNTYVLMKGFDVDSPQVASEKIIASRPRTVLISRQIDIHPAEKTADVVRGRFAWFKTNVIYPYFVKFEMSPRPFRFTAACTGCGACSHACPMRNITMTKSPDGHPCPSWGSKCALCLGCYHVCPHHAVAYGNATRNKGQKKVLTK